MVGKRLFLVNGDLLIYSYLDIYVRTVLTYSFLSSLLSPLPKSPPPRTPNKVAIFSLEKARLKAADELPAVVLALSNNNMINAILLIFDAINVYIQHNGNQQVAD